MTEILNKGTLQCWRSCKKRILGKTLSLLFQVWEPRKHPGSYLFLVPFREHYQLITYFIVGLQLQKWVHTLWLFKSITLQYWELTEWDCVHRIDWWLTTLHPSLVKYVNQVSHPRMISLTLQQNLSMTKCSLATPFKTILE